MMKCFLFQRRIMNRWSWLNIFTSNKIRSRRLSLTCFSNNSMVCTTSSTRCSHNFFIWVQETEICSQHTSEKDSMDNHNLRHLLLGMILPNLPLVLLIPAHPIFWVQSWQDSKIPSVIFGSCIRTVLDEKLVMHRQDEDLTDRAQVVRCIVIP